VNGFKTRLNHQDAKLTDKLPGCVSRFEITQKVGRRRFSGIHVQGYADWRCQAPDELLRGAKGKRLVYRQSDKNRARLRKTRAFLRWRETRKAKHDV